MKWTFFFGAVVFLCFALLACTTAPGPSDDRFDKGSPLSSAGPSEIPVGTSTPAEPDAIQEIQGYSLKDAGLTITADQVFPTPIQIKSALYGTHGTWRMRHRNGFL